MKAIMAGDDPGNLGVKEIDQQSASNSSLDVSSLCNPHSSPKSEPAEQTTLSPPAAPVQQLSSTEPSPVPSPNKVAAWICSFITLIYFLLASSQSPVLCCLQVATLLLHPPLKCPVLHILHIPTALRRPLRTKATTTSRRAHTITTSCYSNHSHHMSITNQKTTMLEAPPRAST